MTTEMKWFENEKDKRFSFLPPRINEKRKADTHLAHCLLPNTRANASQSQKSSFLANAPKEKINFGQKI